MTDTEFLDQLEQYGTLYPLNDKLAISVSNNKIVLHPVIAPCMITGCKRRVVDQKIEYQKINSLYNKYCNICDTNMINQV